MKTFKENKALWEILMLIILIIALMTVAYFFGYTRSTVDVSKRMHTFDTKGEECYTREEVNSFIYGESWTEVY